MGFIVRTGLQTKPVQRNIRAYVLIYICDQVLFEPDRADNEEFKYGR
jgi:hypothetical protein